MLVRSAANVNHRYQVYAASYSHLVLEIERRRSAMEKQDELYRELLKSFEDTYNGNGTKYKQMAGCLLGVLIDELQERNQWFAQHGEYLPQDLCQFMMVTWPNLAKIESHLQTTRDLGSTLAVIGTNRGPA